MDLGLHVVSFTWPEGPTGIAPTLGRIAEAAEASGVSHLSVMDHYFQLEMAGLTAEMDMLEGYTTLGFLAAKTQSIELGVLVTGVTYRYPGLLAKIVTTLDILSGGRAQLGIGAGWYEREHLGLGIPCPPIRERLQRLDETLRICKQMWSDDNGPFEGQHYQLAETLCVPQPISAPHPPILVGGMGEKVLLRIVARHANACNLFSGIGPDGIAAKLDILRGHCDREGTDYDAIKKTMLWVGAPPGAEADEFLSQMEAFAAVGIQEVVIMPFTPDPVAETEALAPVVERLRAMG